MHSSLQLLCLLLAVAAPKSLPASAAGQPFFVTLQAPGKPLTPGSQLQLLATVKNTSDRNLTFISG